MNPLSIIARPTRSRMPSRPMHFPPRVDTDTVLAACPATFPWISGSCEDAIMVAEAFAIRKARVRAPILRQAGGRSPARTAREIGHNELILWGCRVGLAFASISSGGLGGRYRRWRQGFSP